MTSWVHVLAGVLAVAVSVLLAVAYAAQRPPKPPGRWPIGGRHAQLPTRRTQKEA